MQPTSANSRLIWLSLLGIVYGDIGTSPLYALKGCPKHDVVGLISVFLWAIFLIVTLKYVGYILKLDNKGEGGILALITLTKRLGLGALGLSLFLGDSILTPAMSVLGALEGLSVALPHLPISSWIPSLGAILLLGLFSLQRLGTHHVGNLFGPIMVMWFAILAALGLPAIVVNPIILKAFNPWYAAEFLLNSSTPIWVVLGHALLAVTGAEALYADMGHFGGKPIQKTWLWFVWPALMINYLGQGAILLAEPTHNPFYALAPSWGLTPLVVLATLASLIASQAVITGVFSLVGQGIMLGYFPRMRMVHTSSKYVGQVYIPAVNMLLMFGTLLAVGLFKSSDALAMAYGLSVASLMWMTTLVALLIRPITAWHCVLVLVGVAEFALVISSFTKFWHGAWYALLMAWVACYVIHLWRSNYRSLHRNVARYSVALVAKKAQGQPRLPGVGVFVKKVFEPSLDAPLALVLHERSHTWLPEVTICVNLLVSDIVPKIKIEDHYQISTIAPHFHVIQAHYGFKERPDLGRVMSWAREQNLLPETEISTPFYYWARVMPLESDQNKWWQIPGKKLFMLMARLEVSQHELIRAPYARTLELLTYVRV